MAPSNIRRTRAATSLGLVTYPADERHIWKVERGQCCGSVVPLPQGGTLSVGDTVLFALANSRPGQEPNFVRGGDSVRVLLTVVTLLDVTDPETGQGLAQLHWNPPGSE